MSSTPTETPEVTQAERAQAVLKESNEDRKRDKLRRSIVRAHEWRVQVWAQSELKIQAAQAALEVMGGDLPPLMETDFSDAAMLQHYASMNLTK